MVSMLGELEYSGGFQLIEEETVLNAILRYDQGLGRRKHQYDESARP